MTETAWLLEQDTPEGPRYATVKDFHFNWTKPNDHERAFRMSRREDCEALATIMDDADRCVEHQWG